VNEPALWDQPQQKAPAASFNLDQHVYALQGG
jgi:hypothetical protein